MMKRRGAPSFPGSNGRTLRRLRTEKQPLSSPMILGGVMGLMIAFLLFHGAGESAFDLLLSQETNVVSLSVPPRDLTTHLQPNIMVKASRKLFSSLPTNKERTFYADSIKATQPLIRSLRHLGWIKVDDIEDARLIYTDEREIEYFPQLRSWQRYNHIPKTAQKWDDVGGFHHEFREYGKKSVRPQYFLPETYDIHVPSQREEFQRRLSAGGVPWVTKTAKGSISLLKPHAESHKVRFSTKRNQVVQQYICNVLPWDDRSLNLRVYWFVASLDPLIVFYMDGFVRIGSDEENTGEYDIRDEAPWSKLEEHLWQQRRRVGRRISDPAVHVRSQLKESLSQLVDAFKEKTFHTSGAMSAEDGFELFVADYVIDKDLDVWLMQAQADRSMGDRHSFEDHYFRVELHHQVLYGMAMILDEIWGKQEKRLPILPIHNTGKWEMIYADGWKFEYEGYERKPKPCKTP